MQYNNPDEPLNLNEQDSQPQQPAVPGQPEPGAQAGSYPYGGQNVVPGYPYSQHPTQPLYPSVPSTNVPPVSGSGVPVWYQPGTPVPQPGMMQPGFAHTVAQPAHVAQKPARRSGGTRSVAIFALTCVLVVVFGVGIFSGWTFARSGAGTTTAASSSSPSTTVSTSLDSQSVREAAIAKVESSVVEVIGQTSQGTALGSGIIVDKNGDIITNNHVVSGVSTLEVVLSNGRNVSAQLVGTDPSNDLAVLRIQPYSGMTVATLGDSSQLSIGEEVLAIGNPLGYSGTVTSGVVSALNRSARESSAVGLTGLIQTSAPINPGNSGGALINLEGQVVGIPTLSAVNNETNTPANGIGFAIPSNQVKAVLKQIVG